MSRIRQDITLSASEPGTTYRGDSLLDAPVPLGPKDGATLCSPEAELQAFLTNGVSGIPVLWSAVAGASFYVLQWCANSSFNGPSLRASKITAPTVSYNMRFLTDFALGEETFWRVMAFDAAGATSIKSPVFSFTYQCPGGNVENNDIGCDSNGIEVKVIGEDVVKADCNEALYHVVTNFDCEDDEGRTIAISSVAWEIRQSNGNPVNFVCTNEEFTIVRIKSNKSEMFQVVAEVTFTDGVKTFQCRASKDVTIDAHSVSPDKGRHAKVASILGCGLYGIDFVDRTFGDDVLEGSEEPSTSGDTCCFDWMESVDSFGTEIAADIVERTPCDLPVGTDLIVMKINTPPNEECSSSFANTSTGLACDLTVDKTAKWWIIEADTRPSICDKIRGTALHTDSGGWTIGIERWPCDCDTVPGQATQASSSDAGSAQVLIGVAVGFSCINMEANMEVWCEYVQDENGVCFWEITDACCPTP